jgi:hypothetical protein
LGLRRNERADVRRRDGRAMEAIVGCRYSWQERVNKGGRDMIKFEVAALESI